MPADYTLLDEIRHRGWTWKNFPYWKDVFGVWPATPKQALQWAKVSSITAKIALGKDYRFICWMMMFPEVFVHEDTGWRVLSPLERACDEIVRKA